MITVRTRIQLTIFLLITVVGVAFTGAKYANLDRIFVDETYTVVAHFPKSGGAFERSEVTYRGVSVGSVDKLEFTGEGDGVDFYLEIRNEFDKIPADLEAIVANRSAVGEQFVELRPRSASEPYLKQGSEIAIGDTETPVPVNQLLTNAAITVNSVGKDDLQTVVRELGVAFAGTGRDLQTILDTTSSFVKTADANFDVTQALIRDANTVLQTQIESESAIQTFSRNLDLFSTSLAGADPDLRKVIDSGSATATQLRTFIEDNDVNLTKLLSDLRTTGEIVVKHLDGIEHLLVVYPYAVEGGYTVAAKDPVTGFFDAHFGLVLTMDPAVCYQGYKGSDGFSLSGETRDYGDGRDIPMDVDARCKEPIDKTNARGSQNAPKQHPRTVAKYDAETGSLDWSDDSETSTEFDPGASVAPASLGEDTWKWLYLQPMTQ